MRIVPSALLGLTAAFAVAACDDTPTQPLDRFPDADVAAAPDARAVHSTVEDLLSVAGGPVAIAHRGMGENLGGDPSRPIENTVQAMRRGYEAGAAVVEADLQMTADGEIVLWHDDFLDDYTCINSLTRDQLESRAPWIDSFQALLQTARRYNAQNPDRLTGLVTVDLKPASPLCDPDDVTGPAFVSRVIEIIRRMGASDLIYFNSMSPVLLAQAAVEAPEIERQLTLLALQFLTPEQVEAAVGLPVTLIDKAPEFGLQWGEIGPIYRLPGYTPGPAGLQQAIATAHAVGATMVSWDLLLLGQLGTSAAADLVAATQATGLHVFSGDVASPEEWYFGAGVGVEALYADDVPLAVGLQGPLD